LEVDVRAVLALSTLAILVACAGRTGEPDPAPVLDISGTYTLNTVIQGSTVQGRMEITGEPGAWGGSVYTDFTGQIPIASLDMEGNRATLVLDSTQGPVTVLLTFAGDAYTGEWSSGEDGGTVEGRKVES
jgi:hypothetical protein